MKKETLLEKAKKIMIVRPIKKSPDKEEIELAIGWLKSEVGLTQILKVLNRYKGNHYTGNCLYRVAICLREAYRKGIIKIK